jgi:D-aminopeptidase
VVLGCRRIPVGDVVAGDVVQLVTERKHLTDVIEMVAHQAGLDLVRQLTPHCHRASDEAHSRAVGARQRPATSPSPRPSCATIAPLSSPHRTAAFAALAPQRPGTWCTVANRPSAPACVGVAPLLRSCVGLDRPRS